MRLKDAKKANMFRRCTKRTGFQRVSLWSVEKESRGKTIERFSLLCAFAFFSHTRKESAEPAWGESGKFDVCWKYCIITFLSGNTQQMENFDILNLIRHLAPRSPLTVSAGEGQKGFPFGEAVERSETDEV